MEQKTGFRKSFGSPPNPLLKTLVFEMTSSPAGAGPKSRTCLSRNYFLKSNSLFTILTMSFDKETIMAELDRITQRPDVMGGKACIRGMRVTVGMIVGQIGAGHTIEEILADYPYLERADIMQALLYAAWRAEEREVELVHQ